MKKTASAIICFGNKILFHQRDNIPTIPNPGKWQFPGGHIDGGETADEAIKRELLEEVSHSPSLSYVGSIKILFRESHLYWAYVDEKTAKKFRLGEEGQAIRFTTVKEALGKDLTKNVRFYLENFRSLIDKHIRAKTVPSINELGKVDLLKVLSSVLLNR